jgi:hypothetical protein
MWSAECPALLEPLHECGSAAAGREIGYGAIFCQAQSVAHPAMFMASLRKSLALLKRSE